MCRCKTNVVVLNVPVIFVDKTACDCATADLRTCSFFGANMYVKPSANGEDTIDMHHLIDEQETWMGR